MSNLFHPDWSTHVAVTHKTDQLTVCDQVMVQDASGEPVLTYVDDPLLTNLDGYIEPVINTTGASEVRRADETIVEQAYNIVIYRSIPNLTDSHSIRDARGRIFNIINSGLGTSDQTTWILAERINADENTPI